MAITFDTLSALLGHPHDALIDVRSPAEYAEDHIPGAINLPALDNAQRAEIGTLYKQISPFDARKAGAALVARNVADHIDGPLRDKPGGWRPLVYCWRGGQRSGSFASILSQIGWRAETVAGGYQAFRRLVFDALYQTPLPHPVILLDGLTGTAKTDLLGVLAVRGAQTLDLEGLAGHRGSLLGGMGPQPAQKTFETRLAVALARLDPARPVLVEAESAKIGRINLPPMLWEAMRAAPRIAVTAPLEVRAAYLARAYGAVCADTAALRAQLHPLRFLRGHAMVDHWEALLDAGDLVGLATALMVDHYDPAYTKSGQRGDHRVLGTVHASHLDAGGQQRTATDILALMFSAGTAPADP